MQSGFKEFEYINLLSNEQHLRSAAQQMSAWNKNYPQQYCQFLTSQIIATADQSKASLAILILRMLISEVKFPLHILAQMLSFYSKAFIHAKRESMMSLLSLLVETILVQMESAQINELNNQDAQKLSWIKVFLETINSLFDFPMNELIMKHELQLISLYLQHFIIKNIKLASFHKLQFTTIFTKVNSIQFKGTKQQNIQYTKVKGNFFRLVLQNIGKYNFCFVYQYLLVIPSKVCQYVIGMASLKAIDYGKMNMTLNYFLKHVLRRGDKADCLLSNDLQTLLLVSRCLSVLIQMSQDDRFTYQQKIEPQLSQNSRESSIEGSSQLSISEQIQSLLIYLQNHFQTIFEWVFRTLMKFKDIEQKVIFKLAQPFITIFNRDVFNDNRVQKLIQWMVTRMSQGIKGEDAFQSFSYYTYYIHGLFFCEHSLTSVQQLIANHALEDLVSFRFAGSRNMCSVLYYLKRFIRSRLPEQYCYQKIIETIRTLLIRFSYNEFSQALFACFTTNSLTIKDPLRKKIIHQVWPIIEKSNPQQKYHILRSLRERLDTEKCMDQDFIIDLLLAISSDFQHKYCRQQIFVRVQYLRLLTIIVNNISTKDVAYEYIISFLQRSLSNHKTLDLQMEEILSVFAAILYKWNSIEEVMSCKAAQILLQKFAMIYKSIMLHQQLLLEIASAPFSQQRSPIVKLQIQTIEMILSSGLDDRLCDVLQVFFILNQAAISEKIVQCVMSKTLGSPNYYRMAYILSPFPYVSDVSVNLTELKHVKWAVLCMIGKYRPSNFNEISTSSRDKTSQLTRKVAAMGLELSVTESVILKKLKKDLQTFKKDGENSWLQGIEKSSVSAIFSQLYLQRYQIKAMRRQIRHFLKEFGYEED